MADLSKLTPEELRDLVRNLTAKAERAHVSFAKSRSVKAGQSLSRLRHRLGAARTELQLRPAVAPS